MKNAGKFLTLHEFLDFAEASSIKGVLVNLEVSESAHTLVNSEVSMGLAVDSIGPPFDAPLSDGNQILFIFIIIITTADENRPQNAAYLASKKGLDVVSEVSAALVNSSFTGQVMIQSDDSSVLARFRDSAPSYRRVLLVKETVSDAPPPAVEEIKRIAHAVNIPRSSVVSSSGGFLVSSTDVVPELQAVNVSVFVSVLRNEFMAIAFDFLADPIVEIASYLSQFGADGVVTEFPATATAYISKRSSLLTSNHRPVCPKLSRSFFDF